MTNIAENLTRVRAEIARLAASAGREDANIRLIAVSKRQPLAAIREAWEAGQRDFGENYAQEGLEKLEAFHPEGIRWHFIGPIQSNKTRQIAAHFDWVHSVDRLKIAERLSAQRPPAMPPLAICLQVNISGEASKSGVAPEALAPLAHAVARLPGLRLRGLMALPAPVTGVEAQRAAFARLRSLLNGLREDGLEMDALSMGTSTDMEAAIMEGATMVRIGTAVFGRRR